MLEENDIKKFLQKTVKCLGDSWNASEALLIDNEDNCAIYHPKDKVNPAIAEIFAKNMLMKTKSLVCPSCHLVSQYYFFMYSVRII